MHSAAVGEDGSLFTWGARRRARRDASSDVNYGQLGAGDTNGRLVPTRVAGQLPAPVRGRLRPGSATRAS